MVILREGLSDLHEDRTVVEGLRQKLGIAIVITVELSLGVAVLVAAVGLEPTTLYPTNVYPQVTTLRSMISNALALYPTNVYPQVTTSV